MTDEKLFQAIVRVAEEAARDFVTRVADIADDSAERFMAECAVSLQESVEHILTDLGAGKAKIAEARETAADALIAINSVRQAAHDGPRSSGAKRSGSSRAARMESIGVIKHLDVRKMRAPG